MLKQNSNKYLQDSKTEIKSIYIFTELQSTGTEQHSLTLEHTTFTQEMMRRDE